MNKWLKTATQFVLVCILLFNVLMIFTKGLVLPFGIFVIRGDSMAPMIQRYDVIVTQKVPFSELEVSDVIVFERKNEYVTHEIIQVDDDFVVTKGQANGLADDPVTEDSYHSKMLLCIPKLGILAVIYESPVLLLSFIVVVAILVFGIRKK